MFAVRFQFFFSLFIISTQHLAAPSRRSDGWNWADSFCGKISRRCFKVQRDVFQRSLAAVCVSARAKSLFLFTVVFPGEEFYETSPYEPIHFSEEFRHASIISGNCCLARCLFFFFSLHGLNRLTHTYQGCGGGGAEWCLECVGAGKFLRNTNTPLLIKMNSAALSGARTVCECANECVPFIFTSVSAWERQTHSTCPLPYDSPISVWDINTSLKPLWGNKPTLKLVDT